MLAAILYLLLAITRPIYAPPQIATETIIDEDFMAHVNGNHVRIYSENMVGVGEYRAGVVTIHWLFVDGTEVTTQIKVGPK